MMETTLDGFLDGRVMVRQPRHGYRAATDPVFLAASVPARGGDTVLELGCGVGVAALCLAHRVSGVQVTGIEVQPDYAALARENAGLAGADFEVITGDLTAPPADLRAMSFEHVMMNPPFFEDGEVSAPTDAGKSTAFVDAGDLTDWLDCGIKRLRPKGTLSIIHLAHRLPDILAGCAGRLGDIKVLPLVARAGQDAKRVLVQGRKGTKGAFVLRTPFVIHEGASHRADGDDYSAAARVILRGGGALNV